MKLITLHPKKFIKKSVNWKWKFFWANNFSEKFDLPFRYYTEFRKFFEVDKKEVETKILQDICLLICSRGYLEIGPEVAAAAAIFGSLVSEIKTDNALTFANSMKIKYGDETIEKALKFMCFERSRTINVIVVPNK